MAVLIEPRYRDEHLPSGEYVLSEEERWEIGVHMRSVKQLQGRTRSRYDADVTVTFAGVATDTFTEEVYPAFVARFEKEFGEAKLRYLDPDQL